MHYTTDGEVEEAKTKEGAKSLNKRDVTWPFSSGSLKAWPWRRDGSRGSLRVRWDLGLEHPVVNTSKFGFTKKRHT